MILLPLLLLAATGEHHVRPTANPAAPEPAETVVIGFRTRETLDGVYHVEAEHRPKEPGCRTRRSGTRNAPEQGRVLRFRLVAPRGGWCEGDYRATVYFKQTVRCPPTVSCGGSAEVAIGSTTFTAGSDRL